MASVLDSALALSEQLHGRHEAVPADATFDDLSVSSKRRVARPRPPVHVSLGRVGNEAEHFLRGRIDIAEGEPSPPSRGLPSTESASRRPTPMLLSCDSVTTFAIGVTLLGNAILVRVGGLMVGDIDLREWVVAITGGNDGLMSVVPSRRAAYDTRVRGSITTTANEEDLRDNTF